MLVRSLARRWFATSGRLLASDKGPTGEDGIQPGASDFKSPWKVIKSEFQKDVEALVPRSTDVLIIGGGAIGCSAAYWLRKAANLDVTVVERDPVYTIAATSLSVGGLRQQFSEPENIRMSLFTSYFIRNIQEHLSVLDCDPPNVDFCPYGYLSLASEKGAEQLEKNFKVQVDCGAEVELLSPTQLKERWPWMNTEDLALGCFGTANEGWFDPYALLTALRRKALSLGVTFVHGDLVGFEENTVGPSGDRVVLREAQVRTPNGETFPVHFSNVVDAAGPWAQEVANLAAIGTGGPGGSIPLPVEKRRCSIFVVRRPAAGPLAPGIDMPWLADFSGLNVRRKDFAGHYVVFREGLEEDQEPNVADLDVDYEFFDDEVWPSLAHRIPAMEGVKVRSGWAGFYDYNTVDQNLIIGNHPYHKNFVFCNGSSGHGIQHSLAIGRAVSELIIFGEYKSIDLTRLSFDRFMTGETIFEKNII